MVIELKDGNIIVPASLFDALDAVEEQMGADIREYLETWFEDLGEPVEPDEHYREVLETVEMELEAKGRQKKKEQEMTLERVLTMLRREINGEENV